MAQHDSTTPVSERDFWATPDFIFNWLDDQFNFDVDLAASENNHKCPFYFTEEHNALEREWGESWNISRGFLNPPYSDIAPWVEKAIAENLLNGFETAMLIPTPNGEKYYENVFKYASKIIYITGRISFIDSSGKPKTGNTRGSCVVVFGHRYGSIKIEHVVRDDIKENYSMALKATS